MALNLNLLKRLCAATGPSGFERNVVNIIFNEYADRADGVIKDRMGNLVLVLRGYEKNPKKLMLSAHTDEVGFMIKAIDESGRLLFGKLGGIDDRVLLGRRVYVLGKGKEIPGVISSLPIHLRKRSEEEKTTPADEMYIDIGASDKNEARSAVSIGDCAVFAPGFVTMGTKYVSKALDDRLGCAILCGIFDELAGKERLSYDVYFAFTVREETGMSGARPKAFEISPDAALVIETTAIADIPDTPPHLRVAKQGAGGVISLADRSTIYSDRLTEFAKKTAEKYEIPLGIKQYVSGGNDAGHIHKSVGGVFTLALSAPSRYIHSGSNVVDKRDCAAMYDLALNMTKEWLF